jgi:hypothetical protein
MKRQASAAAVDRAFQIAVAKWMRELGGRAR